MADNLYDESQSSFEPYQQQQSPSNLPSGISRIIKRTNVKRSIAILVFMGVQFIIILLFLIEIVLLIFISMSGYTRFQRAQYAITFSHMILTTALTLNGILTSKEASLLRLHWALKFREKPIPISYKVLCIPQLSEYVYRRCAFTFSFSLKFFALVFLFGNIAFVQYFIYDREDVNIDKFDDLKLYGLYYRKVTIYLTILTSNFFILLYKPILILIAVVLLMVISFLYLIIYVLYKILKKIMNPIKNCILRRRNSGVNFDDINRLHHEFSRSYSGRAPNVSQSLGGSSYIVDEENPNGSQNNRRPQLQIDDSLVSLHNTETRIMNDPKVFFKKALSTWNKSFKQLMNKDETQVQYEKKECAICCEDFKEEDLIIELKCNDNHIFHTSCMEKWVKEAKKTTCPLCRSDLRKVYKKYEKEQKRKKALEQEKNNLKKKIEFTMNQGKGKGKKKRQGNLADGFAEEVVINRRRRVRRNNNRNIENNSPQQIQNNPRPLSQLDQSIEIEQQSHINLMQQNSIQQQLDELHDVQVEDLDLQSSSRQQLNNQYHQDDPESNRQEQQDQQQNRQEDPQIVSNIQIINQQPQILQQQQQINNDDSDQDHNDHINQEDF